MYKIKEKWLVSSLFSLASVKFGNTELFEKSIFYLIEGNKSENLVSLTYLAFIADMLQLTISSRNLVKETLIKVYQKYLIQNKFIDPAIAMRLIYIFNTIYKEEKVNLKEMLRKITNYLEYFSFESLILIGWSFAQVEKTKENEQFLKELNEFLKKKANLEDLKSKSYVLCLCNQFQLLNHLDFMDFSTEKTLFQKFYKNIEESIEELEFYKGTRFLTKIIKTEILETLAEEGIIKEIDFLTNSLIKVDFVLNIAKKVILICSEEKYFVNFEGKSKLKPFFQNEVEILEKNEGFEVLMISSKEYLEVGMEFKKIEEEKKSKRQFLKKILKI